MNSVGNVMPKSVLQSLGEDSLHARGRRGATRERQVGIKQIAAELGISVGTVSRAINNRYGVDPATKERVIAAAKRVGYVPDAAARRLKSHPLWRVALLFAPFVGPGGEINPAALATVNALRSEAQKRGLEFQIVEYRNDADVAERCEAGEFDAAITYGHFEAGTFEMLAGRGLPTVALQGWMRAGRVLPVRVDTRTAAYEAVLYLAALGHRQVGLVAGPETELHHRGFHEGFAEAVEEFSLESPPEWRVELAADRLNVHGAASALAPVLANAARRPSAVVFASDWLACGGLEAARSAGLSVPRDLSVTGFDNLPIAAEQQPPLSTFDMHLDLLVGTVLDAATRLLDNPMLSGAEMEEPRVRANFVKRASCALAGRKA
jgi:LacI family transcriptional regulator